VLADHRLGDRRLDALAGPIGEVLIDQLRRVGTAGAAQIAAIEPFTDDSLQLPEQVELWVFPGVAELTEKQAGSKPVKDFRLAHICQMPWHRLR
jgi:hypothetical protein